MKGVSTVEQLCTVCGQGYLHPRVSGCPGCLIGQAWLTSESVIYRKARARSGIAFWIPSTELRFLGALR